MSDTEDPIIPNWVDSEGNRYWLPDEPDGTAYALDGENAGHWVEFGGSGVRKIMDWRDNESLLFLMDLNERIKRGEEPTEEDKRKVQEIVTSMQPLLDVLSKMLTDIVQNVADAVKAFWDGIPEETKAILRDMFPLEDIGTTNKKIREGVTLMGDDRPIGFIETGPTIVNINQPSTDAVAREMARSDFLRPGLEGGIRG